MSYQEKYTAVVLDPHPLWLEAVRAVLARNGARVVETTTSPGRALELLEEHRPDIFITETHTRQGEFDGLSCLAQARERQPELRAIVLSSASDPSVIDRAFAAGAVAFVIKTAHPDDLASVVRQTFDHSVFLADVPRERVPTASPAPVQRVPPGSGLTQRETEILIHVANGHSNAEVARKLWITEQTVKFHLSNIYRKLGIGNRTEASRWAQLQGLLSDSESVSGAA